MRKYRIAAPLAMVALVAAMAMPASATGTQGCSPGYWKTHTESWNPDYNPDKDFYSVVLGWSDPDDLTMGEALEGGGGSGLAGAIKILSRAATAAFLNAAADDDTEVYFPLHRTQIREMLNEVWGDRGEMLELYEYLDDLNNLGAPLCGTA